MEQKSFELGYWVKRWARKFVGFLVVHLWCLRVYMKILPGNVGVFFGRIFVSRFSHRF